MQMDLDLGANGYSEPTQRRKAGDWLANALASVGFRFPSDTPPPGGNQAAANALKLGRLGKVLAVGAPLLSTGGVILGELASDDPTRTDAQKLAGAAGGGGGALAGAAAGAALGAMTGPAAPLAVPVLSALGALGVGEIGAAGGRAVAGLFGPSEADKQLDLQRRQAQQQIALEVERQKALLPVQQKAAEWGMANRAREQALMNPLIAQAQLNQAAAQNLVQSQAASNAQSQLMTQLLMGSILR